MEGWQAPAREYDQESQIVQHSHPTGMEESDRQRIHRLEARVHELECTVSQLLERLGESVGIAGGGGPETLPSINKQLKQACGA